MSYIDTFKKNRLTESINEAAEDVVIFSIDNDRLDSKFLNSIYSKNLDYKEDKQDTFYTLPTKDYNRFEDWAFNIGFDIDSDIVKIEEVDEMSDSGGAGGYNTPRAFGELSNDDIEQLGYKKVKKVKTESKEPNESQFVRMSKSMHINEISYNSYKKDPVASPKHKINQSVSFINKGLKEIEKVVNHNVRLKQEMGVDNSIYWKSSRENLAKISERLLRVSRQLKELSS
jgi:hypothetical protein